MDILERVEKLREKTGVSYEEAKATLLRNDGDLLESLIELERRGHITTGGFYTTKPHGDEDDPCRLMLLPDFEKKGGRYGGHLFWSFESFEELWIAFRDLLRRSVSNQFEVWRADRLITSMPVLVLLFLAVFFFWCTIPLLVVGLFFGFRYRFHGPDLGREVVNTVMEGVSSTVDDLMENLKREFHKK